MGYVSKYRSLIFWLVWGMGTAVVFSRVFSDFWAPAGVFMVLLGFGIFLGLTQQFLTSVRLRRVAWVLCAFVALLLVWKPALGTVQRVLGLKISRFLLVEDVRQMAGFLESAHPDPYLHSGGRIGFHRRMQNLIRAIPEAGMTPAEFYRHLCPLLAAVRDGHTGFWPPFRLDQASPGGIPLWFQAVEDGLYVAQVTDPAQEGLIGHRLAAVESIPLGVLLERQAQIKGYDNEVQLLRYLGYDGSLWYGPLLEHLVPEWKGGAIRVDLLSPAGSEITVNLEPNAGSGASLVGPATVVELPSMERSDYVYRFMDDEMKTVLLILENMYAYRETFEMELVNQKSLRKGLANHLYERYNGTPPPAGREKLLEGIPSATDLFSDLVVAMKENQSENLIIDLRRNQGGNAFISTILMYFLYGKEALIEFRDRRSIYVRKYSPLFWKQYRGWSLRDINRHQPIRLRESDYDFAGYPEQMERMDGETAIRMIEEEAAASATFWSEYQSGTHSGFYRPKNVYLLCSPLTNSSGYAFMYDHWAAGAKLIGVPSSQAGNGFGAWVGFRLKHSWLQGGISHLYITHFRDDPERGRLFRPDLELSYEDLRTVNFDPNAELLFALELSGLSTGSSGQSD